MAWILYYTQHRSVRGVCAKYGISRKTFYKWRNRYAASGFKQESLLDHSRKPHRSPRTTPDEIVEKILEAREVTGFGPRKLKMYLEGSKGIVLSEHTIWKVLKRHFLEEPFVVEHSQKSGNGNGNENGHGNGKRTGNGHGNGIGKSIYQPGEMVHIFHFDVSSYINCKEYTEYSAIDIVTRLRISRIYQGHSIANASEFLKYAMKKFPFEIKHVQTIDDPVYTRRSVMIGVPTPVTELFPMMLFRQDIQHILLTPEQAKKTLAMEIEECDKREFYNKNTFRKTPDIIGEFEQFVAFYNNHRRNDALQGLTPLQTLRNYSEYKQILYFDPSA
jgi:transposase